MDRLRPRHIRYCIAALTALLISSGCASDKKKDDVFEKEWKETAKKSVGHSPTKEKKKINMDERLPELKANRGLKALESTPAEGLPSTLVTLKMNKIPLSLFLKEFARLANVNLLVKDDLHGNVTINLDKVPWNNAFNSILTLYGLDYIWEGNIVRVVSKEDMENELNAIAAKEKRKTTQRLAEQKEDMVSTVIEFDYLGGDKESLDNFIKNAEAMLSKDATNKTIGSVTVSQYNNALVVNGLRADVRKIIDLVNELDKPVPQILIKANIVESTSETAKQLGFQWGGMYKNVDPYGGSVSPVYITPGGTGAATAGQYNLINPLQGGYTPASGASTAGLAGQGFGFNYPAATDTTQKTVLGLITGVFGGNILEMQLSALQKQSKLIIIASPSITTLDNHKAFTESGVKVPYVVAGTANTVPTVSYLDTVLRLEITPHVIDNKNIYMVIKVKKDDVDTSRTVSGNPFIIKKESQTSLIVKDGETIVISGLTTKTDSNSRQGTPFLSDIPILGRLFSSSAQDNQMDEVMIFITPHILPPQEAKN